MVIVIQSFSSYSSTVLRLMLGVIFILHGKFKVDWGYANLAEWLQQQGFPFSAALAYILPWVELIGGVFVVAGLGTRYLSLLFGAILLVAWLKVKLSVGFISGTATGYEFDLLLLVVSLHVAATTPNSFKGAWRLFTEGDNVNDVKSSQHHIR